MDTTERQTPQHDLITVEPSAVRPGEWAIRRQSTDPHKCQVLMCGWTTKEAALLEASLLHGLVNERK